MNVSDGPSANCDDAIVWLVITGVITVIFIYGIISVISRTDQLTGEKTTSQKYSRCEQFQIRYSVYVIYIMIESPTMMLVFSC